MKPAATPKNLETNILQSNKTQALVKRLIRDYLSNYFGQLFIAIFFMAFAGGMTALIALLMQPILDDVLTGGKEELIIPVSIGIAVTFAARGITTYIHSLLMNRIGHYIVADVQKQLFSHFMSLDLSFFHNSPSGTLLSRVVNDVNVMRSSVTGTLTGLGKSIFTLIFLVGVMFYRDWKLTLAAFIVFPILSLFVIYIGKRLRKISKNIQSELGDLSDLLSQTFQGIRVVKAYSMEKFEIEKVSKSIGKVRDLNIKAVRVALLSTPVNEIIVGFIFAGIIIYGGYEVLAGRTTAGHLASFIAAFTLAYEPMKKLAKLNNTLQLGLGATERVLEMLDLKPSIKDTEKKKNNDLQKASVTFENVSFAYEETQEAAITDISFTAETGKVTALVGPSGGGKSTIMNLIPRFYDVQNGAIRINDTNIKEIGLSDLRGAIALVSQDITIFNDTVLQNIKYGNVNASDQDVIKAAKAAAAYDFIEKLEDGYDTIVGENGTKLSGGQKQRISIARAILRDAPILLLDEATSALDNESEKLVQEALRKLEEGRTTIVIAHRLSTVQSADNIIVLDKGEIREQGTHEGLLRLNDLYARMYKSGLSEG